MGMYSYFADEEIEVTDWDGLMVWIEEAKKHPLYTDGKKFDYKNYLYYISKLRLEKESVSFVGFDDMKIISYWYEEFVTFLRDIALFIRGDVEWNFESKDEAGSVSFKDGEVTIHCGQMDWSELTAEEMRGGMNELPPILKKIKTISKI